MTHASERFVAMIALETPAKLDPATIAGRIRTMFPGLADEVGEPPVETAPVESFVIPIGDAVITVLPFGFPVPPETLATALGNELMWREAAAAFQRSTAHILVSVIAANEDPRLARSFAKLVTFAAAAIIPEVPALGVYWSTGEMVVEPGRFVQEARAAGVDGYPSDLWVTFRFFKGKDFERDESIVCRTSGLVPFVGRELECGPYRRQPGELAQLVRGIGAYLVQTGTEFSDGHTIGDEQNVIGRITLERSEYGGDNKAIYRLQLL